jgi:hypothetical protein
VLAVRRSARISATRQRCHNCLDTSDLLIGETAGLAGRPRRHMNGAVSEDERRREIVSHAFGAQFREDRKIENGVRDGQPATNGVGGEVHTRDRAVEKIRSFE